MYDVLFHQRSMAFPDVVNACSLDLILSRPTCDHVGASEGLIGSWIGLRLPQSLFGVRLCGCVAVWLF